MSILIQETKEENGDPKMVITLTNGELKALKSAQEKRKLKDMKSLFDFILAVFVTPKVFFVKREDDGDLTIVQPAEDLLKENNGDNHG